MPKSDDSSEEPISTKTPLRYPGGKTRAVSILDTLLPQDSPISTVLSPFLGGGSYELHLTERGITVVGYDVFQQLTNFWQHLLSSPEKLARAVRARRPVGSAKFKTYQQTLASSERDSL